MEQFGKRKPQQSQDAISMKKMAIFSALGRLPKEEQHKALDRFMAIVRHISQEGGRK